MLINDDAQQYKMAEPTAKEMKKNNKTNKDREIEIETTKKKEKNTEKKNKLKE